MRKMKSHSVDPCNLLIRFSSRKCGENDRSDSGTEAPSGSGRSKKFEANSKFPYPKTLEYTYLEWKKIYLRKYRRLF